MNILTGGFGFNTYSSLDRRIFLLKYSSCKMFPAMYSSAESIVCGGWEAGGWEVRPGQNSGGRGAWPLCIVLLGAGWWRLVPASAPAPTLSGLAIVPPMAGVRAPSPAPPRTAPHTTAAAALSPVTGGSLLYTLHYTQAPWPLQTIQHLLW